MNQRIEELSKKYKPEQIKKIMTQEGWDLKENTIKNYIQKKMKYLTNTHKYELSKDIFQDTKALYVEVDLVVNDFKTTISSLNEKITDWEDDPKMSDRWLSAINTKIGALNSQMRILETAMRKLGEIQNKLIKVDQINIDQKNSVFIANEVMENLLKDGAELKDGKLILPHPKPEIIDVYHKVIKEGD